MRLRQLEGGLQNALPTLNVAAGSLSRGPAQSVGGCCVENHSHPTPLHALAPGVGCWAEVVILEAGGVGRAGSAEGAGGVPVTRFDDAGDDVEFGAVAWPVDHHHAAGEPDAGEWVRDCPSVGDSVGG
jgi:hypothetical protein